MKLEIDGDGLRIEVVWRSAKAALKAVLPILAAIGAIAAAPELHRLGSILGLW
jgi:hypothetical protein